LVSFSVYAFTLRAGFVYDDISITVLKNPFLHGEVSAWDVLLWDRPLREFTYWIDHAIWDAAIRPVRDVSSGPTSAMRAP
jgi:hypothetical protein